MEWLGKENIKKISFAVAGPIGDAIRIGIDLIEDTNEYGEHTEKQATALAFDAAIFCIYAKMSKADKIVVIEEESIIRAFLDANNYNGKTTQLLLNIFNEVKNNTVAVKDYINQYKEITEKMENEKEIIECDEILLESLVALSISDDTIVPAEMEILHQVCDTLEIEREYLTYLLEDFGYQESTSI